VAGFLKQGFFLPSEGRNRCRVCAEPLYERHKSLAKGGLLPDTTPFEHGALLSDRERRGVLIDKSSGRFGDG
jgi:hypothetical protein